ESTSEKIGDTSVPSVGQAGSHPAEGEKNTQQVTISYPLKRSSQPERELIKKDKGKEAMSSKDLEEEKTKSDSDDDTINLTSLMVESSKKKKLKKFDLVTEQEKGPITLKVYREDGIDEVIPKFKAIDLHLSERREVVKACPNRKEAGWSTIYEQIQKRLDYLHKTEAELGIDLDKPLGEQDPIDRLNDLARKILKHADDIHDLFRSTNKFKSSVQYGYHPARTMLNESVLGQGGRDRDGAWAGGPLSATKPIIV
ncbi:hypothetical protein Tco_0552251, partial [Tanacetum coccineum]